ncbi:insulinase family protein [Candidatus Woesearchaeota archaeon]|jgi:predicted Zn-dependent peptidase|nr:insulinase family protein [Candidatus Woesearchaeota archaeon]MBT6520013.1 insulinase family protein [Candidatus Woesearchaeota archaeon]MBT7367740.1 insulinase family protein [Candidatus Woesearchaeota archaeon]
MDHEHYKLDNGLLVALQNTPTKTIAGRLRVWHGALNEESGEEGMAHFLEHLLMTGGSKQFNPAQSESIRDSFGYYNAATGSDNIKLIGGIIAEDISLFLNFISESAFKPTFNKINIEQERQRVLREIADDKSKVNFKDNRTYVNLFYGKNSPHAYNILGNESVIESASLSTFKNFHARGFNPSNADLILVGALPANISELIEQYFGMLSSGKNIKFNFPRNKPIEGQQILHMHSLDLLNKEFPDNSSAELNISLFGPTKDQTDSYATGLLVKILGGVSNSKLFKELSQKNGLAYSTQAFYDGTRNKGVIYMGGSIQALHKNKAIDIIFDELNKLRTKLVNVAELENVKKTSLYNFVKTFETNSGCINAIEFQIDNKITLEQYLKNISDVTPEHIRDAAIKYFPKSRHEGNYVIYLRDPLKK